MSGGSGSHLSRQERGRLPDGAHHQQVAGTGGRHVEKSTLALQGVVPLRLRQAAHEVGLRKSVGADVGKHDMGELETLGVVLSIVPG